ncbi:choline transporter-like protein 1 [Anthonomus grandis grandis]|uniref:choline transporter-like protein 1 n=1 Tax=Anthonomus grandis grandis TaxID=2921223 RepID=UPI002165BC30|nr:choline transporter-like protein 1 [Anthonomus grandis grandis]XP_050308677.1 choline transporter-like protein 1 [Anthonomus grandis grandis]
MGISNSKLEPDELKTFKKLPESVHLADINVPEKIENRRLTNGKWLIILGVFTLIFLPFMAYTLSYSDIQRLFVGYDQCGNTCGKVNYRWEGIPCSGKNKTNYPYLEIYDSDRGNHNGFTWILQPRSCVENCRNDQIELNGKCFASRERRDIYGRTKHDMDINDYFSTVKMHIIISCLFSIVIATGILMLFRHAITFMVWFILIASVGAFIVLTAILWFFALSIETDYMYSTNHGKNLRILASVFTVIAIIMVVLLIWSRKKIKLVIMLLNETTRAVLDMPGLIFVPVVSCVATIAILFIFGALYMALLSAGILSKIGSEFYFYEQNTAMIITLIYGLVLFLWLCQCIQGTQFMIISGSISNWYFTRDKVFLRSPITKAIAITFKRHMGTVVFGSFILTIVQIIKSAIQSLTKNDKFACLVEFCLDQMEAFLKFLSRNAYIVTAIHGQAFLRSGKRAARLIMQNIRDIIAINYIGDLIIGMAVLLVMILSLLVCWLILFMFPEETPEVGHLFTYLIVGIVSLFVGAITFGVYETTMETLFICYCEDLLINNGMEKPFFMSRNLMEFVEESKKVYRSKKNTNNI